MSMVKDGFFSKGVSSLSLVCLAGNVDALEDDVADLDYVSLDSESGLSSDVIEISSSAAQTRYSSLLASLVWSVSSNPSLASFIIFIISAVSNPIFLSG